MKSHLVRRLTASLALTGLTFGLLACGSAAGPRAEAPKDPGYAMDGDAAGAPQAYPQPMPAAAPGGGAVPGAMAAEPMDAESDDMDGAPAAEEVPMPMAPPPAPRPARTSRSTGKKTMASGGAPAPATSAYRKPAGSVKAGEWDDNANYRDYLKYLQGAQLTPSFKLDVSKRRFIVVQDKNGKGVPNCTVRVLDSKQKRSPLALTTTASGRALFFPNAEGFNGELIATTKCLGGRASQKFHVQAADGVVKLKLDKQRALPQQKTIDVAFVLDTTGSMSEEIEAVKGTIRKVSGELSKLNVNVRIGLVEYRDVTDSFTTRVYPMTSNISSFARKVDALKANGGGDTPEHMNEGLRVGLSKLQWNKSSAARMMFVISDAPPHLDYEQDIAYTKTMQQANHGGIQIFTIAASGMNSTGQTVLRQIAQYTGGTNMFVLRGGAGPSSTGGGDAKSSCGGTHKNYSSGNLSGLITDKIKITLKSMDVSPLLIAGLFKDELAKPCNERLVIAR